MNNTQHFYYLDILRGLAALIVLFSHGMIRMLWEGPTLHSIIGSIGVALFFSLSGFLMGYLYSNKEYTFNNVIKYSVSRFARIAPAYLTVIVISYFIFNFIDDNFLYSITNKNILRHLLFSGNVHIFWSIPPEVQFYVYFILFWFAFNQFVSRHFMPILLVALISVICMYYRGYFPGTTVGSHLHFFLFGTIAGIIRKNNYFSHIYISKFIHLATIISIVAYGLYLGDQNNQKVYAFFHYAFLCSIGIIVLSLNAKTVNLNPIEYFFTLIGKWSFSLYLTHDIVLYYYQSLSLGFSQYLNFVTTALVSIMLSYLIFQFLEKPASSTIKKYLLQNLFKLKPGVLNT